MHSKLIFCAHLCEKTNNYDCGIHYILCSPDRSGAFKCQCFSFCLESELPHMYAFSSLWVHTLTQKLIVEALTKAPDHRGRCAAHMLGHDILGNDITATCKNAYRKCAILYTSGHSRQSLLYMHLKKDVRGECRGLLH
jgi:hypothetical protein